MTVDIPCRLGDPVWIIAVHGWHSVRPTSVVRIEIDEDMRPIIYTKGGFGLWGERVFPDAESAMQELQVEQLVLGGIRLQYVQRYGAL